MKIDFKKIAREAGLTPHEYCDEVAKEVMSMAIRHFAESDAKPFDFTATDAGTGKIYNLTVVEVKE